jgi:hypothetical protein
MRKKLEPSDVDGERAAGEPKHPGNLSETEVSLESRSSANLRFVRWRLCAGSGLGPSRFSIRLAFPDRAS